VGQISRQSYLNTTNEQWNAIGLLPSRVYSYMGAKYETQKVKIPNPI